MNRKQIRERQKANQGMTERSNTQILLYKIISTLTGLTRARELEN